MSGLTRSFLKKIASLAPISAQFQGQNRQWKICDDCRFVDAVGIGRISPIPDLEQRAVRGFVQRTGRTGDGIRESRTDLHFPRLDVSSSYSVDQF